MGNKYIQYYVEGKDEERLIKVLKNELQVIRVGKVHQLNVVEHILPDSRLMALNQGTIVVLIFDTDTGHTDILKKNLEKLKKCKAVHEIITIPQVPNLEQELVNSCNIKKVVDLLDSKSLKDFKADFAQVTNLANKLREHQFDIKKLWCGWPQPPYQDIVNKAEKIKLLKQ